MNLKTLFIINTVIAVLFGLGFALVPQGLLSNYGTTLSEGGTVVSRFFGAALLGYGLLTWLVRDAGESDTRKAIVVALFVSDLVGFFVAVTAQLAGAVNALGWSTVVIYLLLAIGFGAFAFRKPAAAA